GNPHVLFDGDDGFVTANPLGSNNDYPDPVYGYPFTGDFTDARLPDNPDHGAIFDFGNFGTLAPAGSNGDRTSFNIYYGAAGSETDALAAISAVHAQLYSLGQPNYQYDGDGNPL